MQIIWSKRLQKTVFARRYTMSIQLTDKAVVKWLNFVSVAQKSLTYEGLSKRFAAKRAIQ